MSKTQKKSLTTIILLLVVLVSLLYVRFIVQKKVVVSVVNTKTTEVIKEEPKQTPIVIEEVKPKEVKLISRGMEEREPHEQIDTYIREVCSKYNNVQPELVMSIVYHESRYDPQVKNGNCVGLMQLSTRWHKDRAERLNVTNFYDPYSNILLGVDYLSELFKQNKDPALVLMLYNMKHDDAYALFAKGQISYYAKSVLKLADEYKKGK